MAFITRNFTAGKMNKEVDERLVPQGQYIDALNIRLGSTEQDEQGVIENALGNTKLTTIQFEGTPLSANARCIGAYEDGANETIYWFVHDNNFPSSPTGKVDMVVSFNTQSNSLTYHVISINDGGGTNTTLNFDPQYLITGVDLIDGMLFWTDDINPPRKINISRNYGNPSGGVDGFSADSVLVIKRPPLTSPEVIPTPISTQENFMEDRFLCFAYRYRYEDGEYSATSQFSEPCFIPNTFDYNTANATNNGMVNTANSAMIKYNTGGPLVKQIDLLFKDMNNSIIKVIEKLDKEELGLVDNTEYDYEFTNSKIFTILPDSEILRLYDNVPRLAKSQTIMGNRLVYGNYLEGYDLLDSNNQKVKFTYETSLVTTDVGDTDLTTSTDNGQYSWNGSVSIANSIAEIELDPASLKSGSMVSMIIRYDHAQFTGDTPYPTQQTASTDITFTYILPQGYNTVYDLATSTDFLEKVGTAANIQTVANCANGNTLTDVFNCSAQQTLDSLEKFESGITAAGQPINVIASPTTNTIGFQLPAVRYVDSVTTPTQSVYEYYDVTSVQASFAEVAAPRSLHSNRGYEVGIIYMDDYNRMSTAQVSVNNNIHVPCSNSDVQNKIRVTIPPTQKSPSWATRYKFCIKPDKKDYDVIYSNIFFRDPASGADYFLIEGENSRKIEEGDSLFVKTDTNGAVRKCVTTTVLEKKAQQADFLTPPPVDSNGVEIPLPAGTYMKLRANNFATEVGDLPVVAYGERSTTEENGGYPRTAYPVDVEQGGSYVDYTIPAGSRIKLAFENERKGKDCFWSGVERRYYSFEVTLTASQDYNNFKDWWDGDNVGGLLNGDASISEVTCDECEPEGAYNSTTASSVLSVAAELCKCNFQFVDTGTRKYLVFTGTKGYSGKNKKSVNKVTIEVIRAANLIVFESDPQDASPDVWYESSDSYPINNGYHSGNVQDQTAGQPAIIDTDFFNCYAFGNGVESYKIKDSIIGKTLELGNRATSTSAVEFKAARRFADLTYSGVYNEESNVNKLNEFNLGLLNFKPLEQSFGPVFRLFGRETDILVLQEDKISYVLAGKNILSDAGGGSALTSVPQVLGNQIARVEKYGISHNPESFVQWGGVKYFTDAKRGSVISLAGGSYQGEQLDIISDTGMRTWFRDLFKDSFNTQKIGGYDPYMGEYVLTSNAINIPVEETCQNCGITTSVAKGNGSWSETYCVELGQGIGESSVTWNMGTTESPITITANWNGVVTSSGPVTSGGSFVFDKTAASPSKVDITVTGTTAISFDVTVDCPLSNEITITEYVITSNVDGGELIHTEYEYVDGTYVSPTTSRQIAFQSGTGMIISSSNSTSAPQGFGSFPVDGSTVKVRTNKFGTDNFNWKSTDHSIHWLRTDNVYGSSVSEISALIGAANELTVTNPSSGVYQGEFTMPATGSNLYILWDLRERSTLDLCYNAANATTACCDCEPVEEGLVGEGGGEPVATTYTYRLDDCEQSMPYTVDAGTNQLQIGEVYQFYANSNPSVILCGTVVSSSAATADATLYSNVVRFCGDTVHCNIDVAPQGGTP